ncbi:DUF3575 domain-containing protein [Bacteroides sp. OttesenSCG-928-E20]|nr:DUF3575 domain-containing protein [Bacteroides sp. OttesenSCG-928-N06]MDL2299550.1 DUF3575 domain-containing protein [Bacteroides sp. OttesenSCG-928-E20]MDL2305027.1 DUF3575 domain-containing protein [Bacteroides sp. OttesenSCG-928-D19]
MKKIIVLSAFIVCASLAAVAQIDGLGLRTNLLGWALASPGLGADISWNGRYLLAVDGNYGDWDIEPGYKGIRHSSYGMELRRYFSAGQPTPVNPHGGAYRGLFMGIDARYHLYNITIGTPHKEGEAITASLLAGYTFRLNKAWAIDAAIGAGYVHYDYNQFVYYPPVDMNRLTGTRKGNTLAITHLKVALVYRFTLNTPKP